jgi:hypothetical protein
MKAEGSVLKSCIKCSWNENNFDPVFGKRWEQYRATLDNGGHLTAIKRNAVWLKHIT